MAQKEKHNSFVMYKNWGNQIKILNETQKALLLDAIYNYQCEGVLLDTNDGAVQMLFSVILQVFIENEEKYKKQCERNRENGKKGGRPHKDV